MKAFFDTSVLIPVFFEDHVHHEASFMVFSKASRKNSYCSAHTLAELFSSLTRMPGRYRTRPDEALLFLEATLKQLTPLALDADEYWSVLQQCGESNIAGGTVYDALIARCALKANARVLYTWNVEHFRRLGPDVAAIVRTP